MGAQAEGPWKRDHPSTGVCRSRLHHAGGGASGSGTSEQIRLLERPGCQTRGPRAPHCVDAVITDPPYSSGGLMLSARQADPAVKYQNTGTVKTYPPIFGDNRDQRSFIMWATLWLAECWRVARDGSPLRGLVQADRAADAREVP